MAQRENACKKVYYRFHNLVACSFVVGQILCCRHHVYRHHVVRGLFFASFGKIKKIYFFIGNNTLRCQGGLTVIFEFGLSRMFPSDTRGNRRISFNALSAGYLIVPIVKFGKYTLKFNYNYVNFPIYRFTKFSRVQANEKLFS